MRKSLLTVIVLLIASAFLFSQKIVRLNKQTLTADSLDRKINELMKVANVHGLAVTVFNNNNPVYKKTFGFKSLETKQPIKTSTNIYGASLSKPVFATMVLKLVEKGILDLDK